MVGGPKRLGRPALEVEGVLGCNKIGEGCLKRKIVNSLGQSLVSNFYLTGLGRVGRFIPVRNCCGVVPWCTKRGWGLGWAGGCSRAEVRGGWSTCKLRSVLGKVMERIMQDLRHYNAELNN